MTAMHDLAVQLFGKCRVFRDGKVVGDLHSGKTQGLFCFLLIHRSRIHSRETLASLHWGNTSTVQSRKYLRTTLWQLRTALKEPEQGGLLLIEPDSVRINPAVSFSLDVEEFEQAYLTSKQLSGQALSQMQLELLRKAADLYRGDLLEGCYQDWCLHERERLQNMYLLVLDKLLASCEKHGNCEQGWSYGARILQSDPACERTHQRLMRLYYGAGDQAGAVRQYERCVTALKQEVGVEPSRQTLELYQQICADKPPNNSNFNGPVPSPVSAFPCASQRVVRLQNMRQTLSSLQRQIKEDIRTLDKALDSGQSRKASRLARRFSA